MGTCRDCGHEYLDSYEQCPFCAQANQGVDTGRRPDHDDAGLKRIWRTVAYGSGLIVISALALFLALTVFSGSDPETGLSDAETCFGNQERVEKAAANKEAQTGDQTVDIGTLLPAYLDRDPVCPGGGEYSIAWTAYLPRCTCSIHPWHGDAR